MVPAEGEKENIRHPPKRLIARPGSLKLPGCTNLGFQKRRRRQLIRPSTIRVAPVRDFALVRFGLEDYALAGAAVHHDADRFRKLQAADTALLFHSRLFRQPLPID